MTSTNSSHQDISGVTWEASAVESLCLLTWKEQLLRLVFTELEGTTVVKTDFQVR